MVVVSCVPGFALADPSHTNRPRSEGGAATFARGWPDELRGKAFLDFSRNPEAEILAGRRGGGVVRALSLTHRHRHTHTKKKHLHTHSPAQGDVVAVSCVPGFALADPSHAEATCVAFDPKVHTHTHTHTHTQAQT